MPRKVRSLKGPHRRQGWLSYCLKGRALRSAGSIPIATVAEIYDAEGTSINSQMVADGQAVIYRRYLSGCSASEGELTSAESVAKDQRLGVWGSAGFIMPWDWRKAH